MLNLEGLKLQELLNSLHKQEKKMSNSLDKILEKYSTDKSSVEEIVFFYMVMYNRATSYLSFRLRCWAYEVNQKKAEEMFEKSLEELMQFKPKGFPLKRVQKLVVQLDELEIVMRKNKKEFWRNYCVPVLKRRDKKEIMEFTSDLIGDGMYILRSFMYDARFYLKEDEQEDFNKLLKRTYF